MNYFDLVLFKRRIKSEGVQIETWSPFVLTAGELESGVGYVPEEGGSISVEPAPNNLLLLIRKEYGDDIHVSFSGNAVSQLSLHPVLNIDSGTYLCNLASASYSSGTNTTSAVYSYGEFLDGFQVGETYDIAFVEA